MIWVVRVLFSVSVEAVEAYRYQNIASVGSKEDSLSQSMTIAENERTVCAIIPE
jgi:hypothetical protein